MPDIEIPGSTCLIITLKHSKSRIPTEHQFQSSSYRSTLNRHYFYCFYVQLLLTTLSHQNVHARLYCRDYSVFEWW